MAVAKIRETNVAYMCQDIDRMMHTSTIETL